MIVNRIHEWARSTPTQLAIIANDVSLNYASFSRAIGASSDFFHRQQLPNLGTGVVISQNPLDVWLLVMGLRTVGLDTIVARSMSQLGELGVINPVCVAIDESHPDIKRPSLKHPAGAKIIMVPAEIYSNIHTGDILFPASHGRNYGGHILYTSGTTGTYKKVLRSSVREERSIERLGRIDAVNQKTIFHADAFGLWTSTGFLHPLAVWQSGGCVVVDNRNDRYSRFFRRRPTIAALIPSNLKMLLQSPSVSTQMSQEMDLIIGGSLAPLQIVEQAFRQITRKITIWYGATECNAIMISRFKTKEDLFWLEVLPDRIVQIVDEYGNECPVGQEGELRP